METENKHQVLKGGEFLIKESSAEAIFIPENLNEEQQMMAQMANDFLQHEVFPNLDRIDAMEEGLMPSFNEQSW